MDLYSLLFEDVNTDGFALLTVTIDTTTTFIMYDVGKMYQHYNEINSVTEEILDKFKPSAVNLFASEFLVAEIEVNRSENAGNCAGAYYVGAAARNPRYRGMGRFMYKLASSVLSAPITSDRIVSTSDSAKGMWRKIENDSSFKKVELDNYLSEPVPTKTGRVTSFNTKYVDIPSPDKAYFRDGPKTPDPSDDCKVPGSSLDNIKHKLGTPDAYQADGVDVSKYRQKHEEAIEWIMKEFGISRRDFEIVLDRAAAKMFQNLYMSEL